MPRKEPVLVKFVEKSTNFTKTKLKGIEYVNRNDACEICKNKELIIIKTSFFIDLCLISKSNIAEN